MKALLISFLIAVALYIALPDPANLGGVKGDTIDGITKDTVCVPGYAQQVRNVPESIKRAVYKRDKVDYPQKNGTVEVDHYIPLSLGGSNNMSNLWVQFAPDFRKKDKVEYLAWRMLCKEPKETLKMAQDRVRNWKETYANFFESKLGSIELTELMAGYEETDDGNP